MVSKLFKLRTQNYTLSRAPPKVYDPETGTYQETETVPVSFEVQLKLSGRGSDGAERPGLEANQSLYDGRVVKTSGSSPLEYPEGVKAGDTFDLTVDGVKGKLELLPVPDMQIPKVRAKLGRKFQAVFEAVG